jgi:hypothetical protein
VDNSKVSFRAALTGFLVVHVADVVEFTAPSAGPKKARLCNCGRPGFQQSLLCGKSQPTSVCPPLDPRLAWSIPSHNAYLELPATRNFDTLEKVV